MADGNPERAVELLRRALLLARQAGLLPWRIQDAERSSARGRGGPGFAAWLASGRRRRNGQMADLIT